VRLPKPETAFLILLFAAIMVAPFASCMEPRGGPKGRVRVLYTGDAINVYLTPYMFMVIEPLVDVTPVVASNVVASYTFGLQGPDMMRKAMRQYMPRSYDQLVKNEDVVILSDSSVVAFTPSQLSWIARSVTDGGLALMMAGGVESFHLGGWQDTMVAKVLPVECLPDATGPGLAKILDVDNEFLKSIPWKTLGRIGFGGSNKVKTKPWATELALFEISAGGANPMMVTGDMGEGRSFAFTPDWTFGWGESFSHWEYYGDFSNNLMLYLAGRHVPRDIDLLHRARKQLMNLDTARGLLISIFDFAEKFGANPAPMGQMLDKVDGLRRDAEDKYIQQDFSGALVLIDRALSEARRAQVEAVRLKDQALLWVYVIEWLAVTATLLISGTIIWALMVRRRYFREIESTRFAR